MSNSNNNNNVNTENPMVRASFGISSSSDIENNLKIESNKEESLNKVFNLLKKNIWSIFFVNGIVIGVTLAVFITSYDYYSNQSTTSVLPKSDIGECTGGSSPLYSFPSQKIGYYQLLNFAVISPTSGSNEDGIGYTDLDGNLITESMSDWAQWTGTGHGLEVNPIKGNYIFQTMSLTANWSTCQLTLDSPNPFSEEVRVTSNYGFFPFSATAPSACNSTYWTEEQIKEKPGRSNFILANDNSSLENSCFELQCTANATVSKNEIFISSGCTEGTDSNLIFLTPSTEGEYGFLTGVNVQSTIIVSNGAVSAQCGVFVWGTFIPYFDSENTVDQSPNYKCIQKTTNLEALSSSLANTITANTITRILAQSIVKIYLRGFYGFLESLIVDWSEWLSK